MLRLHTLGGLSIDGPEGRPIAITQPKRVALLLYLALARPHGFHRRDRLAAMFWAETNSSAASRSLRQALHSLRTVLPPGILVNRGAGEVGLVFERVWCDVHDFELDLDRDREEIGLRLYLGELLPGFHVSCPEFEQWLELERLRLRNRAVRAATIAAHRAMRRNRLEEAAEWSRSAVEMSLSDETTLQESVQLLERIGRRDLALQLTDTFLRRLRTEADLEPTAETLKLRARLTDKSGEAGASENADVGATATVLETLEEGLRSLTSLGATPTTAAYHAYLRGLHLDQHRTPESLHAARRHYHEALRLTPAFPAAQVGLARVWAMLAVQGAAFPVEAFGLSRHHAQRAIALDPKQAEAHAWLALALLATEWDWTGARRLLARAVELDPGSGAVRVIRGTYLFSALGRFDEALAEVEIARQCEPWSLPTNIAVGMVNYYGRRYDAALTEAILVLENDRDFLPGLLLLGLTLEQRGDLGGAIEAFGRAAEATDSPNVLAQLARSYAKADNAERATQLLARIIDPAKGEDLLPPVAVASVYVALDDLDGAMQWMSRAYEHRSPDLLLSRVLPTLDRLRDRPRFRELLMRARLSGR